jgi:hypothetical protein
MKLSSRLELICARRFRRIIRKSAISFDTRYSGLTRRNFVRPSFIPLHAFVVPWDPHEKGRCRCQAGFAHSSRPAASPRSIHSPILRTS